MTKAMVCLNLPHPPLLPTTSTHLSYLPF